jgi:RNA polymerase sigma-70 factor (ECF subfamily)
MIRAYLRALLLSASEVDEVMPEVAIAAWNKFSSLEDRDAFPQWACVIARYEVVRYRRNRARGRLVLAEDVIALIADEEPKDESLHARQIGRLRASTP